MAHHFTKHYTREEAKALLPEVRKWLRQLEQARDHLLKYDKRLSALMEPGRDAGGDLVNSWARTMADFREAMDQFERREILIKDVDRGLLDFPAIIGGKEVFLCWEKDEEDIEFWHDLDAGYAGRERL
ncbi:MAG TPA: DUF2203 domain-containing protein [Candidatus Polarisedimenticolia bacterium]|nr:DUF2203 domain-containing protein [Candidatus Polarisedimenticolia bacterium]